MTNDRNTALEALNTDLESVLDTLDNSARTLVDLNLPECVKLLGHAIFDLIEVRQQIYAERPDLIPPHLRDEGGE